MKPWLDAARTLKRALVGNGTVTFEGRKFRVTAQSRGLKSDRDYAVLTALAHGRQTIFDVGANLGATSLLMASFEPQAQIVALEASEEACRTILQNVALNNLGDRIQVVEAVVAERSGMPIEFFWDHASGGASTIDGYLGHRRKLCKTSLALDDFVATAGPAPDLLKIDVEGAEARVLRGAVRLFTEARPTAIVELHSWQGTSLAANAEMILEWAAEVGYQVVYLRSREALQNTAPLSERGRCHVLLLPNGEALPATLDQVDTASL